MMIATNFTFHYRKVNVFLHFNFSSHINESEKFLTQQFVQQDNEIQLKSSTEFIDSLSSNDLYGNGSFNSNLEDQHVFFGEIQPVMMEALVQRGIYKYVFSESLK